MNVLRKPFKYRNYKAVFWLIGINAVIFILMQFMDNRSNILFTIHMAMIPKLVVTEGWVWTFITYMFIHGDFTHILFNMIGLLIFGIQVERQMGSREFILFYFVTGILAGIFSFIIYYIIGQQDIWLIGASGAIYAVQLAFAVFFPNSVLYIWGILPIRAPIMVLGFTAISLFSIIFGRNSGVAHLTHLAGFGFAWIYFHVRFGMNPWRRLRMR